VFGIMAAFRNDFITAARRASMDKPRRPSASLCAGAGAAGAFIESFAALVGQAGQTRATDALWDFDPRIGDIRVSWISSVSKRRSNR